MKNYKEKVKDILEAHGFGEELQVVWFKMLEDMKEGEQKELVRTLRKCDKEELEKYTKNLYNKVNAMKEDSRGGWTKVINNKGDNILN